MPETTAGGSRKRKNMSHSPTKNHQAKPDAIRIAPQNIEAEATVLGAILRDPEAISRITGELGPDDFYKSSHGKVYEAMLSLSQRSEPVDLLTVADFLKNKGVSEILAADLAAMGERAFTFNVEAAARLVKRCAQQRSFLNLLRQAESAFFASPDDYETIATRLASSFSELLENGSSKSFIPLYDVLKVSLKEIEAAFETKTPIGRIPSGFSEFDLKYGGLHRGDLLTLGARTSGGKTSFAGTLTTNVAQEGYPVAFVSAESEPKKIALRLLSAASGIENIRLQNGILRDADFSKLAASAGRLGSLAIYFLDRVRSWEHIQAKLRSLKLREPQLALIVIDYAQLLEVRVAENKRYLEVSKISSDSKGLAVELDSAVLLLSQLNRESEKQPEREPRLSDLRESGSLEQDSDIVALIAPPSGDGDKLQGTVRFIIAKNRDGRTGTMQLKFDPNTTSFF